MESDGGEVRVRDETPAGSRLRIYRALGIERFADGSVLIDVACNTGNPARISLSRAIVERLWPTASSLVT